MQTQNRFLDDLARVTSGAMGVAAGVRGEVEARVREQLERVLAQMDLVPREEFEVVKAMAAKARSEQEELAAKVAQLEVLLAQKGTKAEPAQAAAGSGTKRNRQKAKVNPKSAPESSGSEKSPSVSDD